MAFGVLILLMTALMLAQMAEIAVTVATVAVVRAAAAAFEAIASADQRAFAVATARAKAAIGDLALLLALDGSQHA